MTLDQETGNYDAKVAAVRDKLGGMANWSIKDDNTGGSSTIWNDWFVLTNPHGEDLRFLENQGWLEIEYGPDWDAGSNNWNNQYSWVFPYMSSVFSQTQTCELAISYADSVGFFLYMNQPSNGSIYWGMASINKTWAYDTTSTKESHMAAVYGSSGTPQRNCFTGETTNPDNNLQDRYEIFKAGGMVNPTSVGGYPIVETNIQYSTQFTDSNGDKLPLGTYEVWARDRSGGSTAHYDQIQTGGGSNQYLVLKEHGEDMLMQYI
jgi:hypothetical protein